MSLSVNLQQQTEKQWLQWQQKLDQAGVPIPRESEFHQTALTVWEASDYVVQCAMRHLELLPELYRQGDLNRSFNEGEMAQRLATLSQDVVDEAGLSHVLRDYRRQQMVRIIWRDLARLAPLDETLEDLSALADSCIDWAVQKLYAWLSDQMGTPRNHSTPRTRTRYAPQAPPARARTTSPRNHQVPQKGGAMVICTAAPCSFQTPSLLEPLTRKTYLPGRRLG